MEYQSPERNHVILPGRETALDDFLNAEYEGMKHKLCNSRNSNSEDALTWTCFDFIRNQSTEAQVGAVKEMIEDAYSGELSMSDIDLTGLRVGLDYAQSVKKAYYFVVLDIAPVKKMYVRNKIQEASSGSSSYHDKWKTAWSYDYYKNGRNNSMRPLEEILTGIDLDGEDYKIGAISRNTGWLTWTNLFKTTLRSAVPKLGSS